MQHRSRFDHGCGRGGGRGRGDGRFRDSGIGRGLPVGALAEPVVEQGDQPVDHGGGVGPARDEFEFIPLPRAQDQKAGEARGRRIRPIRKSSQTHVDAR